MPEYPNEEFPDEEFYISLKTLSDWVSYGDSRNHEIENYTALHFAPIAVFFGKTEDGRAGAMLLAGITDGEEEIAKALASVYPFDLIFTEKLKKYGFSVGRYADIFGVSLGDYVPRAKKTAVSLYKTFSFAESDENSISLAAQAVRRECLNKYPNEGITVTVMGKGAQEKEALNNAAKAVIEKFKKLF